MKQKRSEISLMKPNLSLRDVIGKWRCKTLFMLLSVFLTLQCYSQQVNLQVENGNLCDVLLRLREQTGKRFLFNHEELKQVTGITISCKNENFEEVLQTILKETSFTFEKKEDVYIIIPRKKQSESVVSLSVRGKVTDEQNESLPGVAIRIKGTTMGVTTNLDGEYQLNYTPQQKLILIFSFLGMQTQTIAVDGKSVINVVLKKEITEMDEAVVTGYFDRKSSSFTGAATQIVRDELKKFPSKNLVQILALMEPSLKISENNQFGSDPNKLPDFIVRGKTSFLGANVPLIILDGYEISLQELVDMDVNRIEHINVLKDASATVYYGSRAANGVIVIESRKAEEGQWRINYSNVTRLAVPDLTSYNLMNAAEKLEYERLSGLYSDPMNEDNNFRLQQEYQRRLAEVARGVNTDWLSQPLRNSVSQQHSLYMSGGSNNVTYALNGSYNRNNGVMKESKRENYAISLELGYRKRDKINFRNRLTYNNDFSEDSPFGEFQLYAEANPYNRIRDEYGDWVKNYRPHGTDVFSDDYQYLNWLYNATLGSYTRRTGQSFSNNTSLELNLLPRLRFKTSFAFSKSATKGRKFISPEDARYQHESIKKEEKGRYDETTGNVFNYNLNMTLDYSLIGKKQNLYVGIGMNLLENNRQSNEFSVTGFVDEHFNDPNFALQYLKDSKPSASDYTNRTIGFMANLNYIYDNRYALDVSARLDGSSQFGLDAQYAPFWSIGVGWNVHNEKFMKNNCHWIDQAKIRGSIGPTGSQNFSSSISRSIYKYESDAMYDQSLGVVLTQYGNSKLKWQQNLKKNIGIDLHFWQRRFMLTLDCYHLKTKNLLLPVTVSPSLGFTSYTENLGETENSGLEFNIRGELVRRTNWSLGLAIMGNHNRNKITKISNALFAENEKSNNSPYVAKPVTTYEEGQSMSAIKVVRSLGINPESGEEFFLTGDNQITVNYNPRDAVVVGDNNPDLEGSFSIYMTWGAWSLSGYFEYAFGGQIYNETLLSRIEKTNARKNADRRALEQRWKNPGDETFFKDIRDKSMTQATTRFVQDNNYLNFSNISLEYRVAQSKLLQKWNISSLSLGLSTGDILYSSTVRRERGTSYPFARDYTFNLNISF